MIKKQLEVLKAFRAVITNYAVGGSLDQVTSNQFEEINRLVIAPDSTLSQADFESRIKRLFTETQSGGCVRVTDETTKFNLYRDASKATMEIIRAPTAPRTQAPPVHQPPPVPQAPAKTAPPPSKMHLPLSKEEKKALGRDIRKLSQKYLIGIVPIVQDPNDRKNKGSLEFDIDMLRPETCQKLRNYVNDCLQKQNEAYR